MESAHCCMMLFTFMGILTAYQFKAQSPAPQPSASPSDARALDVLLQDYAYRAFDRPRTGKSYEGNVPPNISGIKISVIRLRSGSFYSRGLKRFQEFDIPQGVMERPYVQRFALVYQDLGNWSSVYYQLPGYAFLTPVLGLLAYDASNLSATNLKELDIEASKDPISIKFTSVISAASGFTPSCVWFDLNGVPQLKGVPAENVCRTNRQGHFSIMVNSTALAPAPMPSQGPTPSTTPIQAKKNKFKVWKIVVSVVGGFLALVLLALLVVCIRRWRQNRKMKEMMQRSEVGEVLQKHRIGDAQLPVASMIRTRPTIENELAPIEGATG